MILVDKIAQKNGITPDEVEEQLLMVAFEQMGAGHFSFWKDVHDRLYGTVASNLKPSGTLEEPRPLDRDDPEVVGGFLILEITKIAHKYRAFMRLCRK